MRKEIFKMEITYQKKGVFLLPDLEAPESPKLGHFGMLHHTYLRNTKRAIFTGLLISGKTKSYFEEIDRQAEEMFSQLIEKMTKDEGVTEELKRKDQLAWVRAKNSIRNRAEEIVLKELIYV